jgi:hypothetical protein
MPATGTCMADVFCRHLKKKINESKTAMNFLLLFAVFS